jgi:hypothetical protein
LKKNKKEEEEAIPPFSSIYVVDYFDEIEKRFEEQSTRKGRVSKLWKDSMNVLIQNCEKLRKEYLPKTNYKRVYNDIK